MYEGCSKGFMDLITYYIVELFLAILAIERILDYSVELYVRDEGNEISIYPGECCVLY